VSGETRLAPFPTAIGGCAIAWSGARLVATHLPERNEAETKAKLAARVGGAIAADPPATIAAAIDAITALLAGEAVDLSFIECDFGALDPFNIRVYEITRAIPPGETLTYGEIAKRLGNKLLAQAVGHALGRNPFPIIVPCHRVLGANGRLTGFSANGGVETKLRMLEIEGARIGEAPSLFDALPLATKPARRPTG